MKNADAEMGSVMDENEIAKVLKRFGDEQSTLLDQYERLSFEVQLNQAILGRSLSEPYRTGAPRAAKQQGAEKRRRGLGFRKVMKKLLQPILGGGVKGGKKDNGPDPKDPRFWKAFSRSLRF